jgi:hypothetical protein
MGTGGGIFLIAVGAVLKFAITDHVRNVNLGTVGVILMIVGAAGILLDLILFAPRRRSRSVAVDTYSDGQQVVRERQLH